ncbi:MAG: RluA family pseudouridine synthase [Faecalibacterium sp.]|nr:RluA family pseudouridine synthase [Ruminococcus sp.]MCM1391418.1 RluA family pseudouridine synthase [Ruminococcus sp.]MCM1485092.1 RluA family pseudouridine synthase [Faecalibacterium sp.]
MKSFTITKNDANQRLDKFLTKSFPNLPKALMYKYIRIKRIKVNSKRAEISTRLCVGDIVDMYINDEFFEKSETRFDFMSASKCLDIIYEDENIMLLNKKVGLLSHPDDSEYIDTLITRIKRYLYEKGEFNPADETSFTPALVNRIDRNTGGIVIAAKNADSLRILNQKMKDRELHKYYLCVVHGTPKPSNGILEGYLIKNEKKNKVFISKKQTDGSKLIRTKYNVLKSRNNLSLVEVDLLTGRTHQIRAHFASIGHPLLGDGKYGKNEMNKKSGLKKQCLCSYKLSFDFTTDAGILSYLDKKSFEIADVWFRTEFENIAKSEA